MTKEKFVEELRNRIPEYLPDRYQNLTFSEKKTNKNNGVELTGILVDDGSGCAPAIYIDKMYDSFCNKPEYALPFEEIIRNLAKTIIDVMDSKPDTDNILKKIKEGFAHVIPKLINAEKNKELLERQDYEIYAATLKERNRIAREIAAAFPRWEARKLQIAQHGAEILPEQREK